jgi:hypothetical protein
MVLLISLIVRAQLLLASPIGKPLYKKLVFEIRAALGQLLVPQL